MTITNENFEKAKGIHNRLQMKLNSLTETKGMTPENPEYLTAADDFSKFDRALRDYTSSQRKVDENGRLTEEPATMSAPSDGDDPDDTDTDYFYEPNVGEVQDFFRRNPGALDRLGLRDWVGGIAEQERREPVLDPMSGAPQGWNVVPAKTHLDVLNEDQSPYKQGADEMYRQKSEEAKRYGTNLKRYRDVHFKPGSKVDYLRGGAGWAGDRVAAPAIMGAADAMSLGQASPLGDAVTDLIDYEAGKRGYDIGPQPKSRDVINRNKPAYVAGQFAGYGLPRNPANIIQGGLSEIGDYAARGTVGKALTAGVTGGAANMFEGALSDFSNYANEHTAPTEGSEYHSPLDPRTYIDRNLGNAAATAGGNAPMNMLTGAGAGGVLDVGASGINSLRQAYRAAPRNAPLRTLEAAGGEAHIGKGVTAPEKIKEYYNESNEVGAHGTAGDRAARDVAPDIEQSLVRQGTEEQARIEREMREYYNHPDYNRIHKPTTPAIQALVDLSQGGFGRDAVDGSRVAMDPPTLKKIGGILKQYARPVPVSFKDAAAPSKAVGGIIIEPELAEHLFGDTLDTGPIRPDQVIVLHPVEVNPQGLTTLEGRIDRELNFSTNRGDKDDPVWNRFNKGIKDTRDQFPLYQDEAGNLVPPPPEGTSQQPFSMDPGAAPPDGEMRVLPPPEQVAGGPQRRPEGMMGVGPGQPDLPSSPFDPRAGIAPGVAADQLPRPIGVGGPGMVARPEGLFGVGPGGPPIPENPFDPQLGTSQEAIRPMMQQSVAGGEYGPPPPLDPNARMGIGPHRRFDEHEPVDVQPTRSVQGDYNKPPEVKMEPAPVTERNPYGFAAQGGRNLTQGDLPAAIGASTDNNGLAMVSDVVKAYGGDVAKAHKAILAAEARGAIELRPEGGLNRLSPEEKAMTIPGPDGTVLSNIRVIDEPMLRSDPTERVIPRKQTPKFDRPAGESLEQYLASGGEVGVDLPPHIQAKIDDGTLTNDAQQKGLSPLEMDLDRGLLEKNGPDESLPAPTAKEWSSANAENQVHMDEIFSPGREARAREVEKFEELAKNPDIIEQAIEAVKKVDERLGPISTEQKRAMVVKMIEAKLGRKIDVEDLIRAGLIGSGMVQLATDDDGSGEGAAIAGMGLFGRGRKGRRSETPGGPSSIMDDLRVASQPPRPRQLEAKLDDGTVVKGFSALRNQQHGRLTAVEKAKQRIGVGKDQTVEDRIRTFGQQEGRLGTDETLLSEAKKIGKEKELRTAAGAAVYPHLKARSQFGGSEGLWKQMFDFFGFRGYKAGEVLAGRFDDKNLRNPFVQQATTERPFWSKPETYAERIQKSLLEDPSRRLLDLSGGAQGARHGDDLRRIIEALQGDDYYEENKDKRQ